MRTMLTGAPLLLLLLLGFCGYSASSQTGLVKALQSHSAILEKFQPSIAKFSKSLTSTLKESIIIILSEMETMVNDAIRKSLAVQMDQLSLSTNGTLVSPLNDICCVCNHCVLTCKACGVTCCCQGDQGCICRTCSTALKMEVNDIGTTMTSTLKLWAESTKRVLQRDITQIVAQTSSFNDVCCSCETCLKRMSGCGIDSCCSEGSECMCKKCSSDNILLMAGSINNPMSLTAEAATAVGEIDSLVDSLLVLLTYP